MTDATLAFAAAFLALGSVAVWLAIVATRADAADPNRLVAQLRLAQYAALLLALASAVYVGLALAQDGAAGAGFDVAIATGFFVLAATATTWEPGRALTALALAWCAHAIVDLGHAADLLPSAAIPEWYPTASAIYDVCMAGVCYLPVLRR